MDLKSYKTDEEVLSPEKFPLDEHAQYFRQGEQALQGGLYKNNDIDSLSALANLCWSRRRIGQ